MDLNENVIKDVANFMGHAETIHNKIYKLPIHTSDIVRMSRILEVVQGGDGDFDKSNDDQDDQIDDSPNEKLDNTQMSSSVISNSNLFIPPINRIRILISSRSAIRESFKLAINPAKNYKSDLLKTVKSQVSTKTKAKIIKIDKEKNGAIHIKCDSVKDKEAITNILNKENKDMLLVNPQLMRSKKKS
ncbi:hypothetical protein FQA39_LY17281 [Lamprigera yunnana]|nr:hypothetical protein FQA39_LY17281 [Lamprigera yunnana]